MTSKLEPLFGVLWPLFLVWTAVVAALWTSDLQDEQVKTLVANSGLRDALTLVLRWADPTWVILATIQLYLALAVRQGLNTARLWASVILVAAATIAFASVRTGWPLGSVVFTERFGPKLGPVPLGWLLWWFVVVIGARMLAERFLPRGSHTQVALGTGALSLLTAINLEPIATKLRLFWFWYQPGTPLAGQPDWRNYLTWWITATALAYFLREPRVVSSRSRDTWKHASILLLFNGVFLITHAVMAFRA